MGTHAANPLPLTEEVWADALVTARSCAKRTCRWIHDQEDCASYCMLTIPTIWRNYDHSRGSWGTYLSFCLINQCRTYIKSVEFREHQPKGAKVMSLNFESSPCGEDSDPMDPEEFLGARNPNDDIRSRREQAAEKIAEVLHVCRHVTFTQVEKAELKLFLAGEHSANEKRRDNARQRCLNKIRWAIRQNWDKPKKEQELSAAYHVVSGGKRGTFCRTCSACGKEFVMRTYMSNSRTECFDCRPRGTMKWKKPRPAPWTPRTCSQCGKEFKIKSSVSMRRTLCWQCDKPQSNHKSLFECSRCGKQFEKWTRLKRTQCWQCQPKFRPTKEDK